VEPPCGDWFSPVSGNAGVDQFFGFEPIVERGAPRSEEKVWPVFTHRYGSQDSDRDWRQSEHEHLVGLRALLRDVQNSSIKIDFPSLKLADFVPPAPGQNQQSGDPTYIAVVAGAPNAAQLIIGERPIAGLDIIVRITGPVDGKLSFGDCRVFCHAAAAPQ
jgi:hypothetical protein